MRVVLSDQDDDELGSAADALRAAGVEAYVRRADVTDANAVDALAEHARALGKWIVLVHCAGLAPRMVADNRRLLEVNLVGTAVVLEAFERTLAPGSVAVCIASVSAYRGIPTDIEPLLIQPLASGFLDAVVERCDFLSRPRLAYAISKRGVQLLCEYRASDWGRRGARICSLSPGGVLTRMAEGAPLQAENIAVGRRADADEIAAVVDFLCSSSASYITGADILVDGGARANYRHHASDAVRERWLDATSD
jgi:NAD(P)-dependent dehydrogenase (short-subunit alcohol dehydrogenase family)